MPGGSSERFVGWFFVAGYAPESTVMDGSDSRHFQAWHLELFPDSRSTCKAQKTLLK